MDKGNISVALKTYLSNLIRRRLREGASQKELADMAKIDPATVSRWLREAVDPQFETAAYAIDRWGGNLIEAAELGGLRSVAALLEAIDGDPDLGDALARILSSDHPLRGKLLADIKDYSKMLK